MSKKLKIWLAIILVSLTISLGFHRNVKESLRLVNSDNDKNVYWAIFDIELCWYFFVIDTKQNWNVDENGVSVDLTKYPYTVWKNPKNGKGNLLYLCSNNNP
jgi:hypothetical protein